MEMSRRFLIKASLCDDKAERILNTSFFFFLFLHITKPQSRHWKYTILLKYLEGGALSGSSSNDAMHYTYLQLISGLLYYIWENKTLNISFYIYILIEDLFFLFLLLCKTYLKRFSRAAGIFKSPTRLSEGR